MNEQQIQTIVDAVLLQVKGACPALPPIRMEPSARHVHVTPEALAHLFGPKAKLTPVRMLSQPGEFLSDLRVNVVTPKGVLERVALLGPVRQAVQLEISLTDCRTLGVAAPVRLSGDMQDAADVLLVGPAGIYEAKGSTIVAKNHIHMTPDDAARYGVHDGQAVRVRAQTPRPITFEQVMVRVNSNFALAMHIDFDEANACALQPDSVGILCVGGAPQAPQEPVAAAKPVTKTGKLITEAIAKTLCGQGDVTFRKGVIVTPAARDIFTNAHIAIAYAE